MRLRMQVERQVAVGHGDDGVDGVGIAAAHQIAELLVDGFNLLAVVELWTKAP